MSNNKRKGTLFVIASIVGFVASVLSSIFSAFSLLFISWIMIIVVSVSKKNDLGILNIGMVAAFTAFPIMEEPCRIHLP